MCKYQVMNDNLLICTVTKELCDFCVFGTQNHLIEGEKMEKNNEKKNEKLRRWVRTFSGDSTESVDKQINDFTREYDADIIQIVSVIQKNTFQADSYIISVLFETRRESIN